MGDVRLSVIIPTHNRPGKLATLLGCLRQQDLGDADYEIIVVDDNSVPPVTLPSSADGKKVTLVRLDEIERSAARNTGAAVATGKWLVFVDDDMTVEDNFLSCHLSAHLTWPNSLVVGSIRLPDETALTSFGRFRQRLEDQGVPKKSGLASMPNFCTAANMSLSRELFLRIGGFDGAIVSSEDQDFALRYTASGGRIVFWPEARAIHRDSSLDIRSYCSRNEWGSKHMIPFCRRYPDRPDNVERHRVNGPLRFGREPFKQSLRKTVKSALAFKAVREVLFFIAGLFEPSARNGPVLERVYRLLLGAHIFRGYRAGLRLYCNGETAQASKPDLSNSNLARESPIKNNLI
ncbi:MAG: glycosyltransferase [Acidobacteriota bacterium]